MASEIAQTLAGLLDASQAERSKAEDKLKSFENQPGVQFSLSPLNNITDSPCRICI